MYVYIYKHTYKSISSPTTAPRADTPPVLKTMLVAAALVIALESVVLVYTATAVGCICIHTKVLLVFMQLA